jgi:hypothetical protein
MPHTLSITLPDAEFEALRAAAAREGLSPEELAAAAVKQSVAAKQSSASPQHGEDPLIAFMRARGHLEDPEVIKATMPSFDNLPPPGSAEEAALMEEVGEELSDALEKMGLSITDLIERR